MEFLRFGSSIPGSYWGCCAVDIIQNFNFDPEDKSSIQLVSGDGGAPVTSGKDFCFAGPTYLDIFNQRLRVGTFDNRDMPNHAFLAVLTDNQISNSIGKKWLAVLKENGFEFIRTVSNSVYQGQGVMPNPPTTVGGSRNHLFGLFRNIGTGGIGDPLTPPAEWTALPRVTDEAWELGADDLRKGVAHNQFIYHKSAWKRLGKPKFLTEAEVVAAGAPVILAGKRSQFPQEPREARAAKEGTKPEPASPWMPGMGMPAPAGLPEIKGNV